MAYNANALKLDFTAIQNSDSNYIALLNFNYPIILVQNIPAFERMLNVAGHFLQREFAGLGNGVTFQVTASYYLRNKLSAEEKIWTGSFHPKGNGPAILSGGHQVYHPFVSETFATTVLSFATEQEAKNQLTWTHHDTQWEFASLISIIVSCQVVLLKDHGFLRNHQLSETHTGRRRRKLRSLLLYANGD